jgi:hypothetical protein
MDEVGREKIVRQRLGECLLATEALLLLTIFRILLVVAPVRWILRMTTRGISTVAQESLEERDEAIALRVRWAVEAAVRHSRAKFVCFPQTLTGYTMLRQRGVQSTMVYGVARSAAGELIAHTWLTVGEKAVLGGKGAGEFTPVERWR